MSPTESLDLDNLPAFLQHLEERDTESTRFARLLLEDGWTVLRFWGPEQMDVWELVLRRGDQCVRFGIERGISDGVHVSLGECRPSRWDDLYPFALAVFAWSQNGDTPMSPEDPDRLEADLVSHGRAMLRWLSEGNDAVLERVRSEWRRYHRDESRLRSKARGNPDADDLRALRSASIDRMRVAALSR